MNDKKTNAAKAHAANMAAVLLYAIGTIEELAKTAGVDMRLLFVAGRARRALGMPQIDGEEDVPRASTAELYRAARAAQAIVDEDA